MCLDIVADLERRTAAVHLEGLDEAPNSATREVWVRMMDAAIERAAKAEKRSRLIRRDTKGHESEASWFAEEELTRRPV